METLHKNVTNENFEYSFSQVNETTSNIIIPRQKVIDEGLYEISALVLFLYFITLQFGLLVIH